MAHRIYHAMALGGHERRKAIRQIAQRLRANGGDVRRTAADLGLGKNALYQLCSRYPELEAALAPLRQGRAGSVAAMLAGQKRGKTAENRAPQKKRKKVG